MSTFESKYNKQINHFKRVVKKNMENKTSEKRSQIDHESGCMCNSKIDLFFIFA